MSQSELISELEFSRDQAEASASDFKFRLEEAKAEMEEVLVENSKLACEVERLKVSSFHELNGLNDTVVFRNPLLI